MKCLICNEYEGKNKNGLATHLRLKHTISYPEYKIKYIHKKEVPKCPECGEPPRYDKNKKQFMTYCVEHANLARASWNKNNKDKLFGGNPGWKKGLNKNNNKGIKKQSDKMKEDNPFYKMSIEKQKMARKKAASNKKLNKKTFVGRVTEIIEKKNLKIITPYEKYKNNSILLKFECLNCKRIFKRSFGNMMQYSGKCPLCTPMGTSAPEIEIIQFLESNGISNIMRNSRDIIAPKELDIYLPDYKYAIEYNGLYWHSEQFRTKNFHKEKTQLCQEKNIDLFHIWSDHWENKRDIVKSMILHHLNLSPNKIYPRNLQIRELCLNKQYEQFFINNHLHGHVKSSVAFALCKNDEIYACLSLKTNAPKAEVEISRFAVKNTYHIPGAFSKLLKYCKKWCEENGYDKIKSYSYLDSAYSGLYENNGFSFVYDTKLDYFYTNGKERYHRFIYRAQNGLSEKEVAEQNGVYRVYGCGNKLWEMKI